MQGMLPYTPANKDTALEKTFPVQNTFSIVNERKTTATVQNLNPIPQKIGISARKLPSSPAITSPPHTQNFLMQEIFPDCDYNYYRYRIDFAIKSALSSGGILIPLQL